MRTQAWKYLPALALAGVLLAAPQAEARNRNSGAVAAGIIGGIAAGALIGSAMSQPSYSSGYYYSETPVYYTPRRVYMAPEPMYVEPGRDPARMSWCAGRYRSYDPDSGTFIDSRGNMRFCG